MEDLKGMFLICTTIVLVIVAGVAGCTYSVKKNNELYYSSMQQCINSGGSFIPVKGGDSDAICLRH